MLAYLLSQNCLELFLFLVDPGDPVGDPDIIAHDEAIAPSCCNRTLLVAATPAEQASTSLLHLPDLPNCAILFIWNMVCMLIMKRNDKAMCMIYLGVLRPESSLYHEE